MKSVSIVCSILAGFISPVALACPNFSGHYWDNLGGTVEISQTHCIALDYKLTGGNHEPVLWHASADGIFREEGNQLLETTAVSFTEDSLAFHHVYFDSALEFQSSTTVWTLTTDGNIVSEDKFYDKTGKLIYAGGGPIFLRK